jgi:hypothetical protein
MTLLTLFAAGAAGVGLAMSAGFMVDPPEMISGTSWFLAYGVAVVGFAMASLTVKARWNWRLPAAGVLAILGIVIILDAVAVTGGWPGFWAMVFAVWAMGWIFVDRLSALEPRDRVAKILMTALIPLVFGVWLIFLWEVIVLGFQIPQVLLPPTVSPRPPIFYGLTFSRPF